MQSLGEKLRQARTALGLDLTQVSVLTKIPPNFLQAIEADDRHSLPGGFFYKNWVKQYAAALSLDVNAVGAEADNLIAGDAPPALPGQQALPQMRPAPLNFSGRGTGWQRSVISVGALLAVIVGCSGLYAWWHNTQVLAGTKMENASDVPKAAPPADFHSPAAPDSATDLAAAPVKQPVQVQASPLEADRALPVSPQDVQIEVAATQQTWLSITPDGKQVFSGVLQPAEVRLIAAHEAATIRVGNAGGITVRLNGKSIGPIGLNGQVRTVVINKTGFQIIEPKPATVNPSPDSALPSPNRASVFTTLQQ